MFVTSSTGMNAALEECPWMAARCPHKHASCDEDDSAQCHYVTTTTANVRLAVVNLRSLRTDLLTQADQESLRELEGFLASADQRRLRY